MTKTPWRPGVARGHRHPKPLTVEEARQRGSASPSSDISVLLLEAAETGVRRPDVLDALLAAPSTHAVALRWLCLWCLMTGDVVQAGSAADRLKRLSAESKVAAALIWLVQLAEQMGRDRAARLVDAAMRLGKASIETRLLIEFLLVLGQGKLAWSLLPSLGQAPDDVAGPLIAQTMTAAERHAYGAVELGKRGRVTGWIVSLTDGLERPRVVMRQKGRPQKPVHLRKRRRADERATPTTQYQFELNLHAFVDDPLEFVAVLADHEVVLAGSPVRLAGAPFPAAAVEAEVWSVCRGVVKGWAFDASRPAVPVRILVRDNVGHTASTAADQPSSVLTRAGIGDGSCAFAVALPPDARRRSIEVIIERTGLSIEGSPFTDAAVPIAEPAASGRRRTKGTLRTLVAPPLLGDDPIARLDKRRNRNADRISSVVDVIVPVYRGLSESLDCITSVLGAKSRRRYRLVCVDDHSPEPELSAALRALCEQGKIDLLVNKENLGFVESVNRAMDLHPGRDAVVLNADTLVPSGWLDRLVAAATTDPSIGTATALSNNATICSYPNLDHANSMPSAAELLIIDEACSSAGAESVIDIPTGVGFCLFIRRACWRDVGCFDVGRFGRGYGEENDFCLRARDRGWRNVVAGSVYVAHRGGVSFGGESRPAVTRAIRVINALYPGYDRFVESWIGRNPLAGLRRAIDLRRLESSSVAGRVLMVTANVTGGTERYIRELGDKLAKDGTETLVLTPTDRERPDGQLVSLDTLSPVKLPNLRYRLPEDWEKLVSDLKRLRLRHVHYHNLIGHDDAVAELSKLIGCPHEVTIHDYSWICKRVNLIDETGRYCGEPEVSQCDVCVQINGSSDRSRLSTHDLRARSRRLLDYARKIIVPSTDTRVRMERHFPGSAFEVESHEQDSVLIENGKGCGADEPLKVAVLGAIGIHKGYNVLLACARDAARRSLPIDFRVIGYTQDDGALLRTGHAWVTGRFKESEINDLLAREACHIAFLPSVWPETWCYALSPAVRAGLCTFVFDIGAMPERLRRMGAGQLLNLDIKPGEINDRFVAFREHGLVHPSRMLDGATTKGERSISPMRLSTGLRTRRTAEARDLVWGGG